MNFSLGNLSRLDKIVGMSGGIFFVAYFFAVDYVPSASSDRKSFEIAAGASTFSYVNMSEKAELLWAVENQAESKSSIAASATALESKSELMSNSGSKIRLIAIVTTNNGLPFASFYVEDKGEGVYQTVFLNGVILGFTMLSIDASEVCLSKDSKNVCLSIFKKAND